MLSIGYGLHPPVEEHYRSVFPNLRLIIAFVPEFTGIIDRFPFMYFRGASTQLPAQSKVFIHIPNVENYYCNYNFFVPPRLSYYVFRKRIYDNNYKIYDNSKRFHDFFSRCYHFFYRSYEFSLQS